jgi:hypothetical protein
MVIFVDNWIMVLFFGICAFLYLSIWQMQFVGLVDFLGGFPGHFLGLGW